MGAEGKDGDRPFHISGVRMERGTFLNTLGRGWETDYGKGEGERARCNPCYDENEQEIPGTTVATAPPGFSSSPAPGADPMELPVPPTPPLTVDQHDAESVAIGWAVTSGSFDVSRGDTGPAAVLNRVRRYLTPELAASGGGLNACVADAATWPAEVTARHGWSVVMHALARPREGHPDPHELTGDVVGLEADISCAYAAAGGWYQTRKESVTVRLQLKRQPDGGYLISDMAKVEYTFPAPADPIP
ncbi:hypothetical protein [Kitasatospora sp. NPDC094011]|uniref:hypothetical protein n=1 Tax=Kitasatospora sp. NPDC094011 TaxID=3364090 RepID=UPI0037FB340F